MDVARLRGGGRSTAGAAPPAAEGAAAVGQKSASGCRHPDFVQGHRGLPLSPPGPGSQPGLPAPAGVPAAQVMRQSEPRVAPGGLYGAARTEGSELKAPFKC